MRRGLGGRTDILATPISIPAIKMLYPYLRQRNLPANKKMSKKKYGSLREFSKSIFMCRREPFFKGADTPAFRRNFGPVIEHKIPGAALEICRNFFFLFYDKRSYIYSRVLDIYSSLTHLCRCV